MKQSDRGRRNIDEHGMCVISAKERETEERQSRYKIVEFNWIEDYKIIDS